MHPPSTRYLHALLGVLRELVPDLTYREVPGPDAPTTTILYIVGVYACTYTEGVSHLVDDGVALTRFFLKAATATEPRYAPPELREQWAREGVSGLTLPGAPRSLS